jgi:hypothetical protein
VTTLLLLLLLQLLLLLLQESGSILLYRQIIIVVVCTIPYSRRYKIAPYYVGSHRTVLLQPESWFSVAAFSV